MAIDSRLAVSSADRLELLRLSRSPGIPYRTVVRSRIVLKLVDGCSKRQTAISLQVSRATVERWAERYQRQGIAGLQQDRPGRGRRTRFPARVIIERATQAARAMRERGQPLSLRRLAREVGISYATFRRYWANASNSRSVTTVLFRPE